MLALPASLYLAARLGLGQLRPQLWRLYPQALLPGAGPLPASRAQAEVPTCDPGCCTCVGVRAGTPSSSVAGGTTSPPDWDPVPSSSWLSSSSSVSAAGWAAARLATSSATLSASLDS